VTARFLAFVPLDLDLFPFCLPGILKTLYLFFGCSNQMKVSIAPPLIPWARLARAGRSRTRASFFGTLLGLFGEHFAPALEPLFIVIACSFRQASPTAVFRLSPRNPRALFQVYVTS
jgi:hypothetical protein